MVPNPSGHAEHAPIERHHQSWSASPSYRFGIEIDVITLGADYPTTAESSLFKGSASDYNSLYAAAVQAIRQGDPDMPVGGPALAYNIITDPARPGSPSGLSLVQSVAQQGLPLDFFSFHVVDSCEGAVGYCDKRWVCLARGFCW